MARRAGSAQLARTGPERGWGWRAMRRSAAARRLVFGRGSRQLAGASGADRGSALLRPGRRGLAARERSSAPLPPGSAPNRERRAATVRTLRNPRAASGTGRTAYRHPRQPCEPGLGGGGILAAATGSRARAFAPKSTVPPATIAGAARCGGATSPGRPAKGPLPAGLQTLRTRGSRRGPTSHVACAPNPDYCETASARHPHDVRLFARSRRRRHRGAGGGQKPSAPAPARVARGALRRDRRYPVTADI